MKYKILIILILLSIFSVNADSFNAYVTRVIDGDTIEVLNNNKPLRIRLAQIDAPESKQPFGNKSRQALANMIFNQRVLIFITGYDKYNRAIGSISHNGIDINKEMVKQGLAWAYSYFVVDKELFNIEAEARKEKRGLWIDKSPIPPWLFRKY